MYHNSQPRTFTSLSFRDSRSLAPDSLRGSDSTAPRKRRWPRVVAALVSGFVLLVYLAPQVALHTPFGRSFIRTRLQRHAEQLDFSSITGGWQSPLVVHGVTYRSAVVDVHVETVRSDRTLFNLLMAPGTLGRLELDSPHVVVRAEQAAPAASAAPSSPRHARTENVAPPPASPDAWPSLELVASGGHVEFVGPGNSTLRVVHQLDFELHAPAYGADATFRLLARTGDPAATAHVSATGSLEWPVCSFPASLRAMRVELVGVDSALAAPLLAAAGTHPPDDESRTGMPWARGILGGEATWKNSSDRSAKVQLNLTLRDCALAIPHRSSPRRNDSSDKDRSEARPGPRDPASCWKPTQPLTITGVAWLDGDSMRIDAAQIVTEGVTLEAEGRVTLRSGVAVTDLKGTLACDWSKVSPSLRPLVGGDVSVTGTSRRSWRITGPVRTSARSERFHELCIDAGVVCDSLHLLDLDFGEVDLSAHWRDDRATLDPITTRFQGGTIAVRPTIDCRSPTPILTVAPGTVLRDATLDSRLCEWILRFVDPLAATSGDLNGRISLDLDTLEIPLVPDGLEQAVIQGRITLDDVDFVPSPSLQEILSIAGVQLPSNLRTAQTIVIRMENGRVYHTGLSIPVRQQQITLDGWVALDHTMQIRVSVPVTEKMLGGDKRLYHLLRNQRIDIPITGTLEKPEVTHDAYSRNVQRLIQAALRDNLIGEDAIRGLIRRAVK
jgi:hypothetical protein